MSPSGAPEVVPLADDMELGQLYGSPMPIMGSTLEDDLSNIMDGDEEMTQNFQPMTAEQYRNFELQKARLDMHKLLREERTQAQDMMTAASSLESVPSQVWTLVLLLLHWIECPWNSFKTNNILLLVNLWLRRRGKSHLLLARLSLVVSTPCCWVAPDQPEL